MVKEQNFIQLLRSSKEKFFNFTTFVKNGRNTNCCGLAQVGALFITVFFTMVKKERKGAGSARNATNKDRKPLVKKDDLETFEQVQLYGRCPATKV